MSDLFLFLVTNCIVLAVAGIFTTSFLKLRGGADSIISTALVFFYQISLTILIAGVLLKNLSSVSVYSINIIFSACLMLIVVKLKKEWKFRCGLLNGIRTLWRELSFLNRFVVVITVSYITVTLLKIYLLPPLVWDVFTYHLPPVMEWNRLGEIPLETVSPVERINAFPMGSKLFHFWFLKGLGERFVELPQFLFSILLMITSYRIMKGMRIRTGTAVRYACIIYFIPSLLAGSISCQDHVVFTSLTFIFLYCMHNLMVEKSRGAAVMAFMAAGLLAGIKITGPKLIILGILVTLAVYGRRFLIKAGVKEIGKWSVIFISLIFPVGGFWFIKNLCLSGSIFNINVSTSSIAVLASVIVLVTLSIFKEKTSIRWKLIKIPLILIVVVSAAAVVVYKYDYIKPFVGHHPPVTFSGDDREFNSKLPDSTILRNLLYMPYRLRDTGAAYSPDLPNISGFGVQFFTFGIVGFIAFGVLLLAGRGQRYGRMVFWFSSILLLSYFTYYFSPYNYRLFSFMPVAGLILWGYIYDRFITARFLDIFTGTMVVVMVLFNIVTCWTGGSGGSIEWKHVLLKSMETKDVVKSPEISSLLKGEVWQYINEHVGENEGVAYWGGPDSWLLPYYAGKRPVMYLGTIPYADIRIRNGKRELYINEELIRYFRVNRISYIHNNSQGGNSSLKIIPCEALVTVMPGLYYIRGSSF